MAMAMAGMAMAVVGDGWDGGWSGGGGWDGKRQLLVGMANGSCWLELAAGIVGVAGG